MSQALDGYVMPPTPVAGEEIASVICGHDLVQAMTEDEQAYFHSFVREVLRSFGVPTHPSVPNRKG